MLLFVMTEKEKEAGREWGRGGTRCYIRKFR